MMTLKGLMIRIAYCVSHGEGVLLSVDECAEIITDIARLQERVTAAEAEVIEMAERENRRLSMLKMRASSRGGRL